MSNVNVARVIVAADTSSKIKMTVTDYDNNFVWNVSLMPDSLSERAGTRYQSYDLLKTGEAKLPNGTQLKTYSWSGVLLGGDRKSLTNTQRRKADAPNNIIKYFELWRKRGTRLMLRVTKTNISEEVTLSDYSLNYEGGLGDVSYDVTFTEVRYVDIYEVPKTINQQSTGVKKDSGRAKPAAEASGQYTVKAGDSLWSIAAQTLGNGSKYSEVYELNKKVIGKDPGTIKIGQLLRLPV